MIHPTLAATAGGSSSVPIIILIVALVGFGLAYLLVGPGRRTGPRRRTDIPPGMRPYHSDEELEGPAMERAMSWGVALAVFASLFLPLYWLIEPDRINRAVDDFYNADVEAGRVEYQNACASCHGVNLEGGSAPHPSPDVDTAWPAPALNNIDARYQDSEIVDDVHGFILQTLTNGRPGTPMNAFSVSQGGTYSDNQLEQIAAYILSVQTGEVPEPQALEGRDGDEVFSANCARCHGADGEGYVGPQLVNVFERYGWSGDDDESLVQARAAVREVVERGRLIPGSAPMPPFEQELTGEAIDAVVEYVASFQHLGGPRTGQLGGPPTVDDDDDEQTEDQG